MRIRSIDITNFKKISKLHHDFTDPYTGEPRDITTIFGANGSGKTTLLQAIAFMLSWATHKRSDVTDFKWHGFLYDRIDSLGDTRIEMQIELSDDEVTAVREIFETWKKFRTPDERRLTTPKKDTKITLVYESEEFKWLGGIGQGSELWGRFYTGGLVKRDRKYLALYEKVGGVFWYDQYRNLGSGLIDTEFGKGDQSKISWQAGVEGLRKYLVSWWNYHQYSNGAPDEDFIVRLQKPFSRVFPNTQFDGLEPMPTNGDSIDPPEFYFMIRRGDARYDISEMSSGEQAVFSVMYDFVRQRIAHSVVLIDELELHLHPPQQQSLYNALPKIGPSCQFIITSHSPYLDQLIASESKIRLHEGRILL